MHNLKEVIYEFKVSQNFEPIYHLYYKKIISLCYRYNIHDHINTLMIRLWKIVSVIDLNNFESQYTLDSYINRSLKNCSINLYKKELSNNLVLYSDPVIDSTIDKLVDIDSYSFVSDLVFSDSLKCLSNTQVKIINLRYKDGLSDIEIAKHLMISRQAVCKARLNALSKLKSSISI